jgi:hypothetical protein
VPGGHDVDQNPQAFKVVFDRYPPRSAGTRAPIILRLIGLNPESCQKISGIRFTNVKVDSWRNDSSASDRLNYLNGNNGGSINGVCVCLAPRIPVCR